MPRLIFKCPYIKGGTSSATAHLENYVKYIGYTALRCVRLLKFNRLSVQL